MEFSGREAAAGWLRPIATCNNTVQNCRSFIGLFQVPRPTKYFQHERNKLGICNTTSKAYQRQPERREAILCRAASTENSTPGSPPSSPPSPLQKLDPVEIELRIKRAANFISTSEKLVPFDPSSTNLGFIIWQAIRDIPPEHRPQLIHRLSSGDIRRLWKVAGQRYAAPPSAIAAALGSEYSLWQDLPRTSAEISYFNGKAALPVHALGISRFSKAFFLATPPISTAEDSEEELLFGRVIHPTPLGNRIYPGPMYFESCIGPAIVPLTNELCDMTISYVDPDEIRFDLGKSIPRSAWPRPRVQRAPFNEGYVDYVRAAGPGVLVGMGYRTRSKDIASSGVPLVPSPLYFIMIKSKIEDLSK